MTGHDHQDDRTPAQRARDDVAGALHAWDCLVESWPWLAEEAIPGPVGPVRDIEPTWEQVALEQEQHQQDSAAKFQALRAGTVPTAHGDAARVGPISTRAVVVRIIRDVTATAWEYAYGVDLTAWPIIDPTTRQRFISCGVCGGTGLMSVPYGDRHINEVCTQHTCRQGAVATGAMCTVCHRSGPCLCDLADAYMSAAGDLLLRALPRIDDPDVAAWARQRIERADQSARNTVHAGKILHRLDVRCPACRARNMVADCTSPDRRKWTISCEQVDCKCAGKKCRCKRLFRVEGQAHRWAAMDWDGPKGLAARLKIKLPGTAKLELPVPPKPPHLPLALLARQDRQDPVHIAWPGVRGE